MILVNDVHKIMMAGARVRMVNKIKISIVFTKSIPSPKLMDSPGREAALAGKVKKNNPSFLKIFTFFSHYKNPIGGV